jgi:2'-5' RNA ligase
MSELVRAFIAVELSEEARAALGRAIRSMEVKGLRGVRWVRSDAMHLTLKFLGEIPPAMVEKVLQALNEACAGTAPLKLGMTGTGAFPDLARPRVLWVGLSGELDALKALQGRVESHMQRLGFQAEARGFSPHVTLGRVRDDVSQQERARIGEVLGRVKLEAVPSWQVVSVNLMKSTLTPDGAIYECIARVRLP